MNNGLIQGDKGLFEFKPPYDKLINNKLEYTIDAIRSIGDLERSGEHPYLTIYKPFGLTEEDFQKDLDNNVSIATLITTGTTSFSLPINRIVTQPKNDGRKYQEATLIVKLGNLPTDENFSVVVSSVHDIIYDTLGVDTTPYIIGTSAISRLTHNEDKRLTLLRNNVKSIYKSYRTRYNETKLTLEKREKYINELEEMIENELN